MKFEKSRVLQNNVFASRITRVEDDQQDCVLEDKVLENDFGPVAVKTGGKFEAILSKDSGTNELKFEAITSKNTSKANTANLKFAFTEGKVNVLMGTVLEFSCDSKQETSREVEDLHVSPKMIAEIKCKVFEEVMIDRLEVAIKEWKTAKTNFEQEILDPVHISLV